MLIYQIKKQDVIGALKDYAASLNRRRITKSVRDAIDTAYRRLRDRTAEDAWYIELEAAETDAFPREFLCPLIMKRNLAVTVFLGRYCSVYTKEKLEEEFRNAAVLCFFPSEKLTDKVSVYFSCLDSSCAEFYDIDYALRLLE